MVVVVVVVVVCVCVYLWIRQTGEHVASKLKVSVSRLHFRSACDRKLTSVTVTSKRLTTRTLQWTMTVSRNSWTTTTKYIHVVLSLVLVRRATKVDPGVKGHCSSLWNLIFSPWPVYAVKDVDDRVHNMCVCRDYGITPLDVLPSQRVAFIRSGFHYTLDNDNQVRVRFKKCVIVFTFKYW